MLAFQSQFSTVPKKQLVLICEKLIDADFEISPYDAYDYEVNYEKLEDIAKYFRFFACFFILLASSTNLT